MIQRLFRFLRALTCWHGDQAFVRHIYGSEVHWSGGYRSLWRCRGCGRYLYSERAK